MNSLKQDATAKSQERHFVSFLSLFSFIHSFLFPFFSVLCCVIAILIEPFPYFRLIITVEEEDQIISSDSLTSTTVFRDQWTILKWEQITWSERGKLGGGSSSPHIPPLRLLLINNFHCKFHSFLLWFVVLDYLMMDHWWIPDHTMSDMSLTTNAVLIPMLVACLPPACNPTNVSRVEHAVTPGK